MSKPWSQQPDALLRELDVDPNEGLSSERADRRLAADGPNQLRQTPRPPAWQRLLAQLKDVTVIALLVAAALASIMGTFSAENESLLERYGDSIAILLIVVLNAVMGFVQEGKAHQALQALRGFLSPNATLLRAGRRVQVPASQVVVGDVVLLDEGSRVPADARLISTEDLTTDESALTGESTPVEKSAADVLQPEMPLAERSNMVFMGSYVQRGSGLGLVTATGSQTEMGSVAALLDRLEGETTPLERQMQRFGLRVVVGCAVLAIVLFGVGVVRLEASLGFLVLTVVSLAVAAIPEGLPAITTVVLALGVRRMAEENAIVRRLAAVEALGAAHIICSDKTGTLTQNHMTVRRLWLGERELDPEELETLPHDAPSRALVFAARFAPMAQRTESDGKVQVTGDPTDGALLELHETHDHSHHEGQVLRVIPFSTERKLASVAFEHADHSRTLYSHGAPEKILSRCDVWAHDQRPMDESDRRRIGEQVDAWAARGLRVLGLARRDISANENVAELEESHLELLGLVALSDPPRPGVRAAITKARGAGVRTLMITGDHPTTAAAIARELGIAVGPSGVIASSELQHMDDRTLAERVLDLTVVARATAADKLRIVRALIARGQVVAMTGDGVNDAPAIRAAAVGVAMGKSGTDVSREVADLVLADDNYTTIVRAIEAGRTIYSNIQRFVAFLFAANAGLVLLVTISMLLGWPAVLTPTQILWINLVTNGLPALALGMEKQSGDPMKRPPRAADAPLIEAHHWLGIGVVGAWLSLVGLWVFRHSEPDGLVIARTIAFTVLCLGPIFYALSARSDANLPFFGRQNRVLWVAALVSVALQAVAVYAPGLETVFGTTPLSGAQLALSLGCAASVLVIAEAIKPLQRRMISQPDEDVN